MNIRPKNKKPTDKHVLHVYHKLWRSRHGRNFLHLSDNIGKKISHVKTFCHRWYDDKKWYDDSKPPKSALS
ncbi:hypothetical protein GLOIN_2v1792113 [Rhizophagus irregularis DAOM 181602=DAOM 197198]|nr:hypothetical protein GLOIN_2v1792113 [Rhizophagus irregularis DAOM 181602=DAOM 197198]